MGSLLFGAYENAPVASGTLHDIRGRANLLFRPGKQFHFVRVSSEKAGPRS